MGMFHSTSGKSGYQYHHVHESRATVIPRGVMKQILQREDELRFSPAYHQTISRHDDLQWIRDVTLALQKGVLTEFGYGDAQGLMALHNARVEYMKDEEMGKLTVYQRMDRSRLGCLFAGDELPNAMLVTMDGSHTSLHEYTKNLQKGTGSRPLVITAGSIS